MSLNVETNEVVSFFLVFAVRFLPYVKNESFSLLYTSIIFLIVYPFHMDPSWSLFSRFFSFLFLPSLPSLIKY